MRRYVYAQETALEKRKIIKGSRWLLLTKDKDVFDEDKKRRLDNILQTNTPLFHAYYLKEDIDQIWMQKSKEEGEKQICYWCERARETKLKPFIKVANTLMNRMILDSSLPQEQRVTEAIPVIAKPDDPLMPSGIIGSVELLEVE